MVDRVALITGGARRVGAAICRRLHAAGVNLMVHYRRSADEVSEIVSTVGLRPVLAKRIHSLSKGYNHRLIIALGFLTRHPILLMDEPFDGFDLRQSRDMMGVLRGVASGGRTLLLSIHQLRDAEQVCDRFALLADGRIRGVGTL